MRVLRPRPPAPAPAARAPWGWAWSGALAGALLATVLAAPAHWLATGVAWASGQQVQLLRSTGTVWTGAAQLVLTDGGQAQPSALPGVLQWRIRPHWRGLDLALSAPCCLDTPWHWRLRAGWGMLTLLADDLPPSASHWPAQLLSGLGTPWNTVQAQGTLALYSQGLALRWSSAGWTLDGQATVDALGLRTALSPLAPLGSYRLTLQGGAQPQLQLSTLDGALQLAGQGHWQAGRWRFTGEASSPPTHQGALGNLLNIIGRREGARSVITVG